MLVLIFSVTASLKVLMSTWNLFGTLHGKYEKTILYDFESCTWQIIIPSSTKFYRTTLE